MPLAKLYLSDGCPSGRLERCGRKIRDRVAVRHDDVTDARHSLRRSRVV